MTPKEFIRFKINPRADEDYDFSFTGKQLFELLEEYASVNKKLIVKNTINDILDEITKGDRFKYEGLVKHLRVTFHSKLNNTDPMKK